MSSAGDEVRRREPAVCSGVVTGLPHLNNGTEPQLAEGIRPSGTAHPTRPENRYQLW